MISDKLSIFIRSASNAPALPGQFNYYPPHRLVSPIRGSGSKAIWNPALLLEGQNPDLGHHPSPQPLLPSTTVQKLSTNSLLLLRSLIGPCKARLLIFPTLSMLGVRICIVLVPSMRKPKWNVVAGIFCWLAEGLPAHRRESLLLHEASTCFSSVIFLISLIYWK